MEAKPTVLVAETLGEAGLDLLKQFANVDCSYNLSHEELCTKISLCDALIIRSATKVIGEVFESTGGRLKVVGRVGVGIGNVDLGAATEHGCLVVNAPFANIVATAQHGIALKTSMYRNIAQSDASVKITTVEEAKKFYPLFGLGENIALIFSGRWGLLFVVMMGLAICGIYRWVKENVPLFERKKKKNKDKPNMTTMEILKFLVSSKYIRDIATLVVAYGININLVEVTWKSKLKAQFPRPNEYSSFMGDFSSATEVATFIMILLSQRVFEKYGWGVAATITPTVLHLTGAGFFPLLLFGGPLAPILGKLGITPLLAAVYVGAL